MPDVSAGSDEGVLATWLVEESAGFDAAQSIAYVETPDELFSVEAGRPGMLLKVLVEPGTRVPPGTPIGILGEPSERVRDLDAMLAGLGIAPREGVTSTSWFDAAALSSETATPSPATAAPVTPELLTVVAERLAERLADPLTGPLTAPVAAPVAAPLTHEAAEADEVDADTEPLGVGQHAASAAVELDASLHHHYLRARVRADRLAALAAQLGGGGSGGVPDLVGRAVVAAHRQVPQLVVARMQDDKSALPGIAVSHPGRFGIEEAVPVVPDGHSVALAVGAVRDEPVVDGGFVVPGKMLSLTLSIRPGGIEDAQASRWLAVLVALLERPEWLVD